MGSNDAKGGKEEQAKEAFTGQGGPGDGVRGLKEGMRKFARWGP